MKKIPLITLAFSLFFFNSCEDYSVTITGKKESSSQTNNVIDGLKDGWSVYTNSACNIIFYYPTKSNFIVLPQMKGSMNYSKDKCIFSIVDLESYLDDKLLSHEISLGLQGGQCGILYNVSTIYIIDDNVGGDSLLKVVSRYIQDESLSVSRVFNRDVIKVFNPGMFYVETYYFKIPDSDRVVCIEFYEDFMSDKDKEFCFNSIRNIVLD